jgi:hypothetical protein
VRNIEAEASAAGRPLFDRFTPQVVARDIKLCHTRHVSGLVHPIAILGSRHLLATCPDRRWIGRARLLSLGVQPTPIR